MNRFERDRTIGSRVKSILPLLGFLLVFLLFIAGVGGVSRTTAAEQKSNLERALYRGTAQCYADRGFYPPTLDYLLEHYGIQYDPDRFFVDYQVVGSNIVPDITVLARTS